MYVTRSENNDISEIRMLHNTPSKWLRRTPPVNTGKSDDLRKIFYYAIILLLISFLRFTNFMENNAICPVNIMFPYERDRPTSL